MDKETLQKICSEIEKSKDEFVKVLRDVVAIESVSAVSTKRAEVFRMADWIRDYVLAEIPGSEVKFEGVEGKQTMGDGAVVDLPPVLCIKAGAQRPEKRTLLVYAHYDVQPAHMSDGWDTEPFVLTMRGEKGDEMRGRGATDDKGPLMGWIGMLRTYIKLGVDFPVNVKFILEGMEESGSVGFDATAARVKASTDFFNKIDFCCISDNYWLTTTKPCVTYGLRGMTSCQVAVTGPAMDLHSGAFGGQAFEPMDDLLHLLSSLKDADNKIIIPGIYDEVMPVTEEEKALYEKIGFDCEAKRASLSVDRIRNQDDKTACLMSVWRHPCLSVHGIEGAYSEPGFKTVIPRRVVGKFSIRTVPNMTAEATEAAIKKHLEARMAERNSPNKLSVEMHTGRWWYADPKSKPFQAAAKATVAVHGSEPDFTREGGSIPVSLTLSELSGADLCLVPMGRSDDGPHSQNEKLDVSNYIMGMQTFAHFLHELSVV